MKTTIYAMLATFLTTALIIFGNWLVSLFGIPFDVDGVLFGMGMFCMWMIYERETSHRACPSVRSEIRKNRRRHRDVGGSLC